MRRLSSPAVSTLYEQTLRRASADPEGFWAEAAESISWVKRWDRVLDDSNPPFYRWFTGAQVNTCYNAIDRHVEAGRGQQPALIYDSPVTGTAATLTYADLREQTARLAGVLRNLGVQTGDRVLIYMPMIPEAAVAMLACARIGAVHSVVFGGFAAKELATRIDDAKPQVVLTASCGIEIERIIEYKPLLDEAIAMSAHKPAATVLLQRPQHNAALGAGDHDWQEAMAAAQPALAGERADPDTVRWAEEKLDVPVIDHWWQTETGWPIAANCVGLGALPVKHGSPTKVVPGYDVRILEPEGDAGNSRELPPGETGAIALRLPLPPGCLPTLWKNDAGYVDSYLSEFEGYYQTGDAGFVDQDGYLYIMSRTDDLINVAGHRLSTGAMEEILSSHPDVAECAVIGIADSLKGQAPLGLAVLYAGSDRTEAEIVPELVQTVRDQLGPVASFKIAAVVDRLPKTRSGKVLRGTMRRIADGEPYTVPATIDDPSTLDEIEQTLADLGYPRHR